MFLANYLYFLEIISCNNCHQSYVTALLYCPNHFCRMPSHSKVTDALRRQVVQMDSLYRPLREMLAVLKVSYREFWNCIMTITHLTQQRKPNVHVNKSHHLKIVETAAEISRQIYANLGKKVSRYTVSRRLSQVKLKARPSAIKHLISKTRKVEDHVTCTDDNWSSVMWTTMCPIRPKQEKLYFL